MSMNDKGLTLVEVLAAVVILGILFVGIMSIFPQMTLFNAKTETKLDTMNLARQEMASIVGAAEWQGERDLADPSIYEDFKAVLSVKMPAAGYAEIAPNPDFIRYVKVDDYRYEADIYLSCQPFLEEDENSLKCHDPSLAQLHKIHLKVYEGSRVSSETYSYIKFVIEKKAD
ncbi:type II secretion system protein [uncultured Planococcus sp.]|uniref:PulJ/GspJ family protein n=1 Tax=uncultured Planococcus sp. TaxID=337815 RepID=UPI002611E934|nr:type II secretion system protein [uncultured Planococcus sp.]